MVQRHVTEEMIRRVIDGMENQKERLYFDFSDGLIAPLSPGSDSQISLPPWKSRDGYDLMLHFTENLPGSPFKDRLKSILDSGQSVFRHFKDALKAHPEIEGQWRRYKFHQMSQIVTEWFARCAEALNLEELGVEPEDLSGLPLDDFSFRPAEPSDKSDIERLQALYSSMEGSVFSDFFLLAPGVETDCTVAEDPMGRIAGYAASHRITINQQKRVFVSAIYTLPDFRNLGVEEQLIETLLRQSPGPVHILTDLSQTGVTAWMQGHGQRPLFSVWGLESSC